METANAIVVGDVVSGLEPNELVEVRRLVPFGPRTLLEGVTLQCRREIRPPLAWSLRVTPLSSKPRQGWPVYSTTAAIPSAFCFSAARVCAVCELPARRAAEKQIMLILLKNPL